MKLSSIEWYRNKMLKLMKDAITKNISGKEWNDLESKSFEVAQEIHYDEITHAVHAGYRDGCFYSNGEDWYYQSPEHYYKENFNNKEK